MEKTKYVIYYNRKNANGNTYKHYFIREGTYCLNPKFAIKFEDELNARMFAQRLPCHRFVTELFND